MKWFHLLIPLSTKFAPENVLILDTESENRNITVLGYYRFGEPNSHHYLFPTPIPPKDLAKTNLFRGLVRDPTMKIGIYNTKWEAQLFDLPPNNLVELMQYPYRAKEDYIRIESIDKISGRKLPKWEPGHYQDYLFHNYSCLVKESILYAGLETFSRHNVAKLVGEGMKNVRF